jgi:hypothetical protein
MHLVQILLPLYDNSGAPQLGSHFEAVERELTDKFGGLTAYTRAPAEGLWKEDRAQTRKDDIVVHEVMCEQLDREWWREYRRKLEARFRQEKLIVRSQSLELL